MITRVWWGRTTVDGEGDYVEFLRTTVLPAISEIEGHRGSWVLRRDLEGAVEFGVITLWESMAAVRNFAGDNPEVAVIPPEAEALLSDYDPTVTHYEMIVGPE